MVVSSVVSCAKGKGTHMSAVEEDHAVRCRSALVVYFYMVLFKGTTEALLMSPSARSVAETARRQGR